MLSLQGYSIVYIVWNLFLAAIPCTLAYQFQKKLKGKTIQQLPPKKQYLYLAGFLLWVAFLPNTAYLISLVRHLLDHCSDYDAYRVCVEEAFLVPFFFCYALLGVPSFWYALKTMAKTLGKLIHPKVTFWLPLIMIPLSALAILFGLIDRLNSWDLVTRPLLVLKTAWNDLTDPHQLLNLILYTAALALIYYGVEGLKRLKIED